MAIYHLGFLPRCFLPHSAHSAHSRFYLQVVLLLKQQFKLLVLGLEKMPERNAYVNYVRYVVKKTRGKKTCGKKNTWQKKTRGKKHVVKKTRGKKYMW
jgi:hypothetical protein